MKKILLFITLVFALIALLSSCSAKKNDITNSVKQYLQEKNLVFEETLKTCLIIPSSGCPGCIASGITFLNHNRNFFTKNQVENMVVFTNVGAKKLLRRSLRDIDISDLYCIIDNHSQYSIDCPESKYPIILYLDKGKVVKADYQSPDNNGIEKYLDYLINCKQKQ